MTAEVIAMTSQAFSDGKTATRQITVFLLDDHEVVRRGVSDLLEAEPDIKVIGQAGTASSALARIPALRPDVAVLDVRLPDGDGVGPAVPGGEDGEELRVRAVRQAWHGAPDAGGSLCGAGLQRLRNREAS